ncbi:MAG: glutamine amidotransferase [Acinetobacter sp.]
MPSRSTAFSKTIYAIQHLAFEDLGTLEDVFYELGYRVRYFEAGVDDLAPALAYDGLTVILGGPIGVYETDDYPFLKDELKLLKQRLNQQKPTLGICLGAQLIAAALGAKVYAGHHKEIGWSELILTEQSNNILAPLSHIPVLHWHGDTFDLPQHAIHLASSHIYKNQAFQIDNHVLALQFHLEVDKEHLEKWLIGHRSELGQAKIDIAALREDNHRYAPQLANSTASIIRNFVQQLDL